MPGRIRLPEVGGVRSNDASETFSEVNYTKIMIESMCIVGDVDAVMLMRQTENMYSE